MNDHFNRGDLIKAATATVEAVAAAAEQALPEVHPAAVFSVAAASPAAVAAVDQYWYACYDKSIGLVTKADAIYIWVRWFGSRSDQNMHKYYNKTEYFKRINSMALI